MSFELIPESFVDKLKAITATPIQSFRWYFDETERLYGTNSVTVCQLWRDSAEAEIPLPNVPFVVYEVMQSLNRNEKITNRMAADQVKNHPNSYAYWEQMSDMSYLYKLQNAHVELVFERVIPGHLLWTIRDNKDLQCHSVRHLRELTLVAPLLCRISDPLMDDTIEDFKKLYYGKEGGAL